MYMMYVFKVEKTIIYHFYLYNVIVILFYFHSQFVYKS